MDSHTMSPTFTIVLQEGFEVPEGGGLEEEDTF